MKLFRILTIFITIIFVFGCDNAVDANEIPYLEELGLKLTIKVPDNNEEMRPGIIFFHSGAWYLQDKSEMNYMLDKAIANGYVAASVDYRLTTVAPWPAQLKDARTAVRWLKVNAETYGVDPDRIGVAGHSAGGHISMMTAFTQGMDEYDIYTLEDDGIEGVPYDSVTSDVAAVTSWAGPSDVLAFYLETHMDLLVKESRHDVIRLLLFGPGSNEEIPLKIYNEEPLNSEHHVYSFKKNFFARGQWYEDYTDIFAYISPFTYAYNNTVPLLLIQGQMDTIVQARTHKKLISELKLHAIDYEYKSYSSADHLFTFHKEKLKNDVIEFMDKHLK